jgi:regulatory protein
VDEGRDCAKGIVERFVSRGFVDDAGYARAKAGDLLRRGYGARRVGQALNAAGIDEEIRSRAAPGEGARRAAVLALARRRRFGPFARGGADDALSPEERRRAHEKRLAAMLRAGHNHGDAQAMLAFARVEEAEQWVSEGYEDADEDEKPQDDKWGQLP